jgi:hypothetical protein
MAEKTTSKYLRVREKPIFIFHTLPSKEENFSEFR